jgi:hypothetical protein
MTHEDLEELVALERKASPAPYYALFANDDLCTNATFVTKNPSTGRVTSSHGSDWQADHVIADCVVQSPRAATSDDKCWDENAV